MIRFVGLLFLVGALPGLAAGGDDPKDPKNWTPVKILGNPRAPEFADIGEWVNSEPLTMKGLKGKVVVVHFMAFG
jgi:hypothetical protein